MPTYRVRNKETKEEYEIEKGISEMDQYLEDHPELQRIIVGPPTFGDAHRLGIVKEDQGFRETMEKIHEKTPGSTLKDNFRW